jgi:hypothetical protein
VRRFIILFGIIAALFAGTPAQAYVTDGLYLDLDSHSSASYSTGNPTEWNDLSVNARHGVIYGSVTPDNITGALVFDGTGYGTNYVDLSGAFDDWGNGLTVDFIGEFGAHVDGWERIVDFGNGEGSDNIWVGRFGDSQDLALEIWLGGTSQGRCHTTSGLLNSRELTHWVITLDSSLLCHIYRDGVEQPTQLHNRAGAEIGPVSNSGTAYPAFPNSVARTSNYVGRSNWGDDHDFEGSIEMIRVYNRAPADEGPNGDKLALTGFDPLRLNVIAFLGILAVVSAIRLRPRRISD